MLLSSLTAISPVDGRYSETTASLRPIFSEYGLIRFRFIIEIRWLQFLSQHLKEIQLTEADQAFLNEKIATFSENDAQAIKTIEKTSNHDLKAVEYFLKQGFSHSPSLEKAKEFIHFACTSDDINNLAYSLMLKAGRDECLLPALEHIQKQLSAMAHDYAALPMLARTHGQAATPTTLGKEMANIKHRLDRQIEQLKNQTLFGKLNGAVGNFNAHHMAYPELDWPTLAKTFVESLGLSYQTHVTQIEPHDGLAEYADIVSRLNTILIDFSRDMWAYISLAYFSQKKKEEEVGSSTMPHKINPIDFENAEGNLSLANALWHCFSSRLPISRWQRDLVDSTLLRNLGVAHAHTLIACKALSRGLNKVYPNLEALKADLAQHWEVLTEAIQTVMRRYGLPEPYEQLKALSRGKMLKQSDLSQFIDGLKLPNDVKKSLKDLSPHNYLGYAEKLARM